MLEVCCCFTSPKHWVWSLYIKSQATREHLQSEPPPFYHEITNTFNPESYLQIRFRFKERSQSKDHSLRSNNLTARPTKRTEWWIRSIIHRYKKHTTTPGPTLFDKVSWRSCVLWTLGSKKKSNRPLVR